VSTSDEIFDLYIDAYRGGEGDPRPFLDMLEGRERDQLGDLIELFLDRAEPAEWDPVAFEKSPAADLVERMLPDLLTPERGWCDMLPGLRTRQEKTREQVARDLATALGARNEAEEVKVADYYHDMEYGNLKPQGVSQRVLSSLAEIYGTTVEALRRAGEKTVPSGGSGRSVFARGVSDADQLGAVPSFAPLEHRRSADKPDRIDLLFTDPDYDDLDR